jgi:hypothetical protein
MQMMCIKNHSPSDNSSILNDGLFANLTKYKAYAIKNFWDDERESDLVFYDDLGYCHVYDHYKDYFISMDEWRNNKLDNVLNN